MTTLRCRIFAGRKEPALPFEVQSESNATTETMTFFRTSLVVLAAFACGTVTAAVFVSRPILGPESPQPAQASTPAAAAPSRPQTQDPTPRSPPSSARVIPLDRSPDQQAPQTTGAAASERSSTPAERAPTNSANAMNSCDQSACSRKYHSFDSATCTYQPYGGAERRRCEK